MGHQASYSACVLPNLFFRAKSGGSRTAPGNQKVRGCGQILSNRFTRYADPFTKGRFDVRNSSAFVSTCPETAFHRAWNLPAACPYGPRHREMALVSAPGPVVARLGLFLARTRWLECHCLGRP